MNKAVREWFDWRGWMLIVSAAIVLLALLAILWPGFRMFVAHPATASWAAAIATAAASVIALVVSTSTMRAFRIQQRDREELGASIQLYVEPELGMLLSRLGGIPCRIERIAVVNAANRQAEQDELAAIAETIQAPSAKASLEQLHLLPNRKGRTVAHIVGLLPQWKHSANILTHIGPDNQAWAMLRRQVDGLTGSLAILIFDYFDEDMNTSLYVDLHRCIQIAREDHAEFISSVPK